MLTTPLLERLASCRQILLAGCGGGYDVLGGLPLFEALRALGKQVYFASLSFCYLDGLGEAIPTPGYPNLYPVVGRDAREDYYCPEAWLARFLEKQFDYAEPIWCFTRTGVRPLQAAYRYLQRELELDAIVLLDGGVDVLLAGNETALGTPEEDLTSLAAVYGLDVPLKLVACLGLGAELRDGICHEQVLARIAQLQRHQAYLGAGSLLDGTPGGALYRRGVEYLFAHQRGQRQSHVHKLVLQAMAGEYGAHGEATWLTPLLNLLWYFDLDGVATTHLFLDKLQHTSTPTEVALAIEAARNALTPLPESRLPI